MQIYVEFISAIIPVYGILVQVFHCTVLEPARRPVAFVTLPIEVGTVQSKEKHMFYLFVMVWMVIQISSFP